MSGIGTIAVFGSSEPPAGDPLYEAAREAGRLLATRGVRVATGGYGGVMEGASRGAVEAGGSTLGVTCAIFSHRAPNRWIQTELQTANLHDRTRDLIDAADGFLVMDGKAGTLSELSFLWALERAGCLGTRRVVALGDRWSDIVETLRRLELLEPSQWERTRIARRPAEAVEWLLAGDGAGREP